MQSIKQDSVVNKGIEIERESIGITGIVYKDIVLYELEQVPWIVYAPLVARLQEKYAWIEYTMA